ncbi:MAG: N-acetylmuramoyl-L-alanine amidase [Robiginitomaculum sp.]|nr:MAG: N-acetylmuramoyl-L-alanine amidase [Robiginitomaculum sp.]
MKFIDAPSPNHDDRTLPISLLVLHYTGMENGEAALVRMFDPKAKVSAHYMVEEDGRVFRLVDESRRAWHAGLSSWNGENDINSASVGIEIVNGGHDFGLPHFPNVQIKAVISLCRDIMLRHKINNFNVVAHSDIAPTRKQDPGEKFPWPQLADADIGNWPEVKTTDQRILIDAQGADKKHIRLVQSALSYLGYDIKITCKFDSNTKLVVQAFQRRYRPVKIDGQMDVQTIALLILLVKYKQKTHP